MSNGLLEVVDGYTLATLSDGSSFILHVNQALLEMGSSQTESLLQPHQVRAANNAVDDCATCHLAANGEPGTQSIFSGSNALKMNFDGWKCYFVIRKASPEEFDQFPHVHLTSATPYEPQRRRFTRRVHKAVDVSLDEWRARLGYPTLGVTSTTIKSTTQMVASLKAETREYMRDHYKTRSLATRPRRLSDRMYSDTFFSSVPSIRGFKCFQMFAFKKSKFDKIHLMRKESQNHEKYLDVIRDIGAPDFVVTDNAKSMTGSKWSNTNRYYCIGQGTSEPHHQNQNYSEGRGGNAKNKLIKLFHETPHAPIHYWCYGLEHIDHLSGYLANKSLNGRTPREALLGETPDISVFRFRWFQPVWYYSPDTSFPEDKMIPGFFLGVAPSVGDGFSYKLLPNCKDYSDIPTHRNPTIIIRSVVRSREINDSIDSAPICRQGTDGFKFFNVEGEELVGSEELSESDDDAVVGTIDGTQRVTVELPDEEDDFAHYWPEDNEGSTFLDQEEQPASQRRRLDQEEEIINSVDTTTRLCPPTGFPFPLRTPDSNNEPDRHSLPIISQSDSEEDECDSEEPIVFDDMNLDDTSRFDGHSEEHIIQEVENHFNRSEGDDELDLDAIVNNRYLNGILELEVMYTTGDCEWHPISLVQDEDPHAVANYVMKTDLGTILNGKYRRWARKFLRSLRRAMRRFFKVDTRGFQSNSFPTRTDSVITPANVQARRRAARAAKATAAKKVTTSKRKAPTGNNRQMGTFKYGIEVPRKWADVVRLDRANSSLEWHHAVEKEMASLIKHKCFDFKHPGWTAPSDYQYAPLHMVYDVKVCGRKKARFVCNGSRVDPKGLSTRATVVKGVSVRLLDIIADHLDLSVLTGDIGNAFIQAHTKEKVWTSCGPEFGDMQGSKAVIIRALYGLTTSAERYRTLFADFLRGLGFNPTRFDRDVWMRKREAPDGSSYSGYDYICTHVDDFKIVAKDPERWMTHIEQTFLVKESGVRDYYLGNNYKYHEGQDLWSYGCDSYVAEAIKKVEAEFWCLRQTKTPMPTSDCHPELDNTPLLSLDDHRRFQMLLGMLQWMVTIGRPDLCHGVAMLNRFGACPREYHLELALGMFEYLKKFPTRQIAIDARPLEFTRDLSRFKDFHLDFLGDYPDAREELDPSFPEAFGTPLETTICVDADHAHDLKTRRSITGLIAFVGSTPVTWFSRRQGSIASSTYAAEFSALRSATEEAQNLRYMLRCLGIPIPNDGSCPTNIFNDNFAVVNQACDADAELHKKHVAISFHVVREAIASGAIRPLWVKGQWNVADIFTKQIGSTEYLGHCDYIFYKPQFHLRHYNRLSEVEESAPGSIV